MEDDDRIFVEYKILAEIGSLQNVDYSHVWIQNHPWIVCDDDDDNAFFYHRMNFQYHFDYIIFEIFDDVFGEVLFFHTFIKMKWFF